MPHKTRWYVSVLITDDGAFAGYNNFAVIPDYEDIVYCGISDDMDDLWYGDYYGDPANFSTYVYKQWHRHARR